jgi:hypothetical protein
MLILEKTEYHRITGVQGRLWDLSTCLKELVSEAGFENVEFSEFRVPVGSWAKDPKLKEIGRYFRAQFVDGAVESYSLALFTRFGNWTSAEVQVLLARVRAELRQNKIHLYSRMYVTLPYHCALTGSAIIVKLKLTLELK